MPFVLYQAHLPEEDRGHGCQRKGVVLVQYNLQRSCIVHTKAKDTSKLTAVNTHNYSNTSKQYCLTVIIFSTYIALYKC